MVKRRLAAAPAAPGHFLLKAVPVFLALLALLPFFASESPRAATLEGLPGTSFTPSATPLGRLGFSAGASAFGHADADLVEHRYFLFSPAGSSAPPDTNAFQNFQSATLRLNAVLGVAPNFEIGLSVPYHLDVLDDSDTEADRLSGTGFGDPSLTAKAGFALAGDHVLDAGLLAKATLPSKSPEGFLPRHTGYLPGDSAAAGPRIFSAYRPGYEGRFLLSLDLTRLESRIPFRAHAGAGLHSPGIGKPDFILGGALEWAPLPFLGFFAGAHTATPVDGIGGRFAKDLALASAGFKATSEDGMFISVGAQKRLSDPAFQTFAKEKDGGVFLFRSGTAPNLAFGASLGWTGALVARDMDGDGVPDKQDPCPNEAEDKDGFQDFDGCPERDNDEDGVHDLKDKCPGEPEDKDGFQDADGCPDADNDGDDIPDALDKCPSEPEDMDGHEDYDGCPDLDNDKDGIPDAQDRCPLEPEDKDGFQDADGCPDADNDGDGVPDPKDKCPSEPETTDGFEDEDGCPDLPRHGGMQALPERFVLSSVRFRHNTTEMLTGSYPSLDSLAARLKADPGLVVEIRGYTDLAGSELDQLRISESWATTVRKYLLLKGVPRGQVAARGMGARDALAPNSTAAGRRKNRRIEVHRLD
jgi:outer membrane protein OmpA-like peptidoglycan-associated protein